MFCSTTGRPWTTVLKKPLMHVHSSAVTWDDLTMWWVQMHLSPGVDLTPNERLKDHYSSICIQLLGCLFEIWINWLEFPFSFRLKRTLALLQVHLVENLRSNGWYCACIQVLIVEVFTLCRIYVLSFGSIKCRMGCQIDRWAFGCDTLWFKCKLPHHMLKCKLPTDMSASKFYQVPGIKSWFHSPSKLPVFQPAWATTA